MIRPTTATARVTATAPAPASLPFPAASPDRSGQAAAAHSPIPDPLDDAPALEALEKKITTLAARIHAATHRLLTLIAEFDRRQGWKLGGHRSCAHWLSHQTGIDLGTAREKVRTARALVPRQMAIGRNSSPIAQPITGIQ